LKCYGKSDGVGSGKLTELNAGNRWWDLRGEAARRRPIVERGMVTSKVPARASLEERWGLQFRGGGGGAKWRDERVNDESSGLCVPLDKICMDRDESRGERDNQLWGIVGSNNLQVDARGIGYPQEVAGLRRKSAGRHTALFNKCRSTQGEFWKRGSPLPGDSEDIV